MSGTLCYWTVPGFSSHANCSTSFLNVPATTTNLSCSSDIINTSLPSNNKQMWQDDYNSVCIKRCSRFRSRLMCDRFCKN